MTVTDWWVGGELTKVSELPALPKVWDVSGGIWAELGGSKLLHFPKMGWGVP